MTQTVFFTGKGGVGKSTLCAAYAWQLSRAGRRVLAVSLDPAHSLGDVFGRELSGDVTDVDETLSLSETDVDRLTREQVRGNVDLLKQTYGATAAFNLDGVFDILQFTPGLEEYAVLAAIERALANSEPYDCLVFDTPPTGLTLKILALPVVTLEWLARLVAIRRQILRKRYTIHKIAGKDGPLDMELPFTEADDPVLTRLLKMEARYQVLRDRLEGAGTSIVLVLNPDRLSERESERLIDGLCALNLPLRHAVTNKVREAETSRCQSLEKNLADRYGRNLRFGRVPYLPGVDADGYRVGVDLLAMLGGAGDGGGRDSW